jgi:gluconate kinase
MLSKRVSRRQNHEILKKRDQMTPSNFKSTPNHLAIVVMGVSDSGKSTVCRLLGSPELIRSRLRARSGHFMPESLVDSQFSALEAPEDALTVSIDQPVAEIVSIIIQELSISKT